LVGIDTIIETDLLLLLHPGQHSEGFRYATNEDGITGVVNVALLAALPATGNTDFVDGMGQEQGMLKELVRNASSEYIEVTDHQTIASPHAKPSLAV